MRLEFVRRVGIALEIIPVGESVAKQDMDNSAGEGAIRARPHA